MWKVNFFFICCTIITKVFPATINTQEENAMLGLKNKTSIKPLTTHCLVGRTKARFPGFFTDKHSGSVEKNLEKQHSLSITVNAKITPFNTSVSSDIIIYISTFLGYSDQLKLSHVNSKLKVIINEEFWENQIREQKYLLWNTSIPRAKVFFANYFYLKGFGQDPRLPERIAFKLEDVMRLSDFKLAKKALDLGFPKGKKNYNQVEHVEHKKRILRRSLSAGENSVKLMETVDILNQLLISLLLK